MKTGYLSFLIFVISIYMFATIGLVSAFEFNGTVYDINGNALNNSIINITMRNIFSGGVNGFVSAGYNSTTTNASGWFNITIPESVNWLYEPLITHKNGSYVDYVGQSLPAFPVFVFTQLRNNLFYLREAGTINITAINSSGGRIPFNYQIKDSALGYLIASNFGDGVLEANIVVPRDRNYSITVFPNQSLPAFFNWNNFTSTNSYNIVTTSGNISRYNATTRTLYKQFNITLSLPQITGFINASNVTSTGGWDEFTVVPFMLEPGNMVHATFGAMPFNLSTFIGTGLTDLFNLTSGFYNITLPASAETANYLLFATARNGSRYYGGVANISLSYGAAGVRINFSMYGLIGASSNFSLDNANNFAQKKNRGVAKQVFQLVNATNSSLSQSSVHIETTVDYSNYGAIEFTWVEDVGQSSSGNFSIPLLNITGIKEMNIFVGGGNYAPKRIAPTIAQLITDNNANGNVSNITINSFNPQAIDSALSSSSITMGLYISNLTCDVPDPPGACVIGSSTNMQDFNPMSAIIGGGKLSFRMGTAGILVHYVNVDMMASGPPDALFDDKTKNGTSGNDFSAALRFGSSGPTVYDYVLVSVPYSESASTGLNDTQPVNISIPVFYDDNWNVIWNATVNGTNSTAFAGNFSHYSNKKNDWQYLLNNITCTTNSTLFNITNPCYINTTSNQIWVRLPHFSGTGPSITGAAIPASSSPGTSTSTSSGGGGSGAVTATNKTTKTNSWTKITPGNVTIMKINDKEIGLKEISIEVNNPAQNVKVTVIKYDGKPVNVSVEKSGKVYKYLEIQSRNLENNIKKGVITLQVEKSWLISNGLTKDKVVLFRYDVNSNQWNELETKYINSDSENEYFEVELMSFSFFAIAEKIERVVEEAAQAQIPPPTETPSEAKPISKGILWLIIGVIIILGVVGYYTLARRNR